MLSAFGGIALGSLPTTLKPQEKPGGDVIVLIPGIMGSVLQRDGKDIWAVSAGAFGQFVSTGGESIKSLALRHGNSPGAPPQDDGVVATRVFSDAQIIPGLWKVDGYTKISSALRSIENVKDGENFFQ